MLEVVGSGIAGLLAANMLQRFSPIVYERQQSLPHNHSALLRFRTSTVGDVLGIPFKKVKMIKSSIGWKNPVADALAYSFKVTGEYRSDRSIVQGTVTDDRYIAPPDLINRMARQLPQDSIHFDHDVHFGSREGQNVSIISTVPMPTLMEQLNYPKRPNFPSTKGVNIHANIEHCDAYVSLTIPDPICPVTRISITGDEAIIECTEAAKEFRLVEDLIQIAATFLGIPHWQFHNVSEHQQHYQKIAPIDDDDRKRFMHWATDRYNIFSLGRFATWRPGLQTDDLIQDVRKISTWLNNRYDLVKSR